MSDSTTLETRTGCIAAAMSIIGSKWTALILRDLSAGPKRFSQLEKSVGRISPRTLSQRLNNLEQKGIISKTAPGQAVSHTVYDLTGKGSDLIPVLEQMAAWGEKYTD